MLKRKKAIGCGTHDKRRESLRLWGDKKRLHPLVV